MDDTTAREILNALKYCGALKRVTPEMVMDWSRTLPDDVTVAFAVRIAKTHMRDKQQAQITAQKISQAWLDRAPRYEQASGPTCGRRNCMCTHTECDHGWLQAKPIDLRGLEYEAVKPCPVCRGDRMPERGESREDWLRRLRGDGNAA